MGKKILKLRVFLWLVLFLIVSWLFIMKIVPFGHLTYVTDLKNENYFINKLTPSDRLKDVGNGKKKIIGDPVYFSLFTPRGFDQAKVTLKYRIDNNDFTVTPIVELGVLADKVVWRYDLKPVDNEIINRLSLVWNKVETADTILLSRNDKNVKKYNNIDEFLKNLPSSSRIALYNYDLKNNFKIPDYKADGTIKKIDDQLRGTWQLYTYIKNEDLDFNLELTDINKNKDRDPVDLNLYYDGELIDTRHLDDSIEKTAEGKIVERNLQLNLPSLPEGVYKLELKVNDDIITKQITTKQNKISFINKLWLSSEKNPVKIFTDSRKIEVLTANPKSLQNVKINDNIFLTLDKTYKQFSTINQLPIAQIVLEKGDLTLSGNKLFAFAKEALFDPEYVKVDANFDVKQAGIDYILAKYSFPKKEGDWQTSETRFDLSKAYRENSSYNFLISIPGLDGNNENNSGVILDEIKVELNGKSLWQYLKNL